jgi:hypothetical protein
MAKEFTGEICEERRTLDPGLSSEFSPKRLRFCGHDMRDFECALESSRRGGYVDDRNISFADVRPYPP